MPTLTVTKNYDDGQILTEEMLDDAFDSIETFLNTTKLGSDNIQDEAIETVNIAVDAVTTAKISDSNVTTAKIADSNVTTAKIADSNVTTAKIADSNVTTAKIADGAVTQVKRAALSYSSTTTSSGNITATSYTEMGSVSITRTGRPVMILISPKSNDTRLEVRQASASNESYAIIRIRSSASGIIFEDALFGLATRFSDYSASFPNMIRVPATITYLDTSGVSGSTTYYLDFRVSDSSDVGNCGVTFSAIEL